ncbi:MAG: TATA box-binding protein, partial [Thaumarchaeota archaeon]|nr:TATA box-binding protein [Nitrososphaerota archaeon]
MVKTKPIVSIENVVASASIDEQLNLAEITKKFSDVKCH